MSTVILDNGGYNIKIGTNNDRGPRSIPNSIVKSKNERKRVFVAQEQEECTDKFSLFYVRPIEKGYVTNWDAQQKIWEKAFSALDVETTNSRIVYTDNNYLIPALPDLTNEIFFEHFGFTDVCKASSSTFIAEHSFHVRKERCACVIDVGFSWTTIACFVDGLLIQESVIRIDVGGKALTNKLKDWISYRQLNVSEETYVINECKEDLCYVALDFDENMKNAKKKMENNNVVKRYTMPDFQTTFRGIVKEIQEPHDPAIPSIHLGVERFAIPEILFK
uniref:Actin-related protein 6 n=1 Tax=Caenorhabditis japonica TaxID=281687 RepID=A0A8R1DLR5_CAEJA